MRDGFITVASATPEVRVADCVFNGQSVLSAMEQAEGEKVKILVLPELCLTGYTCGDLFLQPTLLQGAEDALSRILEAQKTQNMTLLAFVGLPVRARGVLYNCAAVCQSGEILGVVIKSYIPNTGEFGEKRHFVPAPSENSTVTLCGREVPFGTKLVFACAELPELVVGVEICEDLWVLVPPSNTLAGAGATVICNLSASNEVVDKAPYRRNMVVSQSARLLCTYIYTSAGEGESTSDLVFSGHDMIAENGVLLAEQRFETGLIKAQIDVCRLAQERRRTQFFGGQRPAGFQTVLFHLKEEDTELTRPIPQLPFVPEDEAHRRETCREIFTIAAQGLRRRLQHTNAKTAVLGLSGGLDSTLALLITLEAFDRLGRDRKDILAVTMPCFGTTARTRSNAEILAQESGVTLRTVDIGDSVRSHFRDIGQSMDCHDVTFENGQARERTQVLMDLANKNGGLVIGTGDLSELALGWATYNGDHMSMYGVNGGIPKTMVRYLVDYAASETDNQALAAALRDVLATPVSPELLPAVDGEIAQKTEDLVGPYELHDFFLFYALRWAFPPKKILRLALHAFDGVYDRETILKWLRSFYRRFFAQQFKRNCLPDGPKVGSVSLSPRGDWKMPADAVQTLWRMELEGL